MTCEEIIAELQANASEKYKANVVKMGIPQEYSIGVSTAVIRSLAKKCGKSNELAFALWQSGYHEAKLLAVLIFEKNQYHLKRLSPFLGMFIPGIYVTIYVKT